MNLKQNDEPITIAELTNHQKNLIKDYIFHENQLSQFITADGTIDMRAILTKIEKMENKKYLDMHPYAVFYNSEKKLWQTYLIINESLSANRKRKRISSRKRGDLEGKLINFYRKQCTIISTKSVMQEWIDYKLEAPKFSQASADRYTNVLIKYFGPSEIRKRQQSVHISDIHSEIFDMDINKLDDVIIARHLRKVIIETGVCRPAWIKDTTAIRGFFKYCKNSKYTQIDINDVLNSVSDEESIFSYATEKKDFLNTEETKKIIQYIESQPMISLRDLGIEFCLFTGIRCGELAGLRKKDFDISNYKVIISRTEIHHKNKNGNNIYGFSDDSSFNKTHKAGEKNTLKRGHHISEQYLTDDAINIYNRILELNPNADFLFETENGKLIHSQSFTKRLKSICKKIGIPQVSMHSCRKHYASALINGGASEEVVQLQMRHKDISTTRNYYKRAIKSDSEKLAEVRNALIKSSLGAPVDVP